MTVLVLGATEPVDRPSYARRRLEALRPCPAGAVPPCALGSILGKRLVVHKEAGKELLWTDLASRS